MAITTYTSYNEIRAVCGMSTDELPDTDLALEIYANALSIAMRGVNLPDSVDPGNGPLINLFTTISGMSTGRTDKQQQLYDLTRMFATYAVADEVLSSIAMRAVKAISDSKATLTRFSGDQTYTSTQQTIQIKLNDAKIKLENLTVTEVYPLTFMGVASPDTDVVTD